MLTFMDMHAHAYRYTHARMHTVQACAYMCMRTGECAAHSMAAGAPGAHGPDGMHYVCMPVGTEHMHVYARRTWARDGVPMYRGLDG